MRRLCFVALLACGADPLVGVANEPLTPCEPGAVTDAPSIDDTVIHSPADVTVGNGLELWVGMVDYAADGNSSWYRTLARLNTIPQGSLLGWRMLIWQASSLGTGRVDILRVANVNEWSEDGAAWCGWAGSPCGLGDATDTEWTPEDKRPAIDYGPSTGGLHIIELPVAWLEDWRSGVWRNNGMLLREKWQSEGTLFVAESSEPEEHPLTFEVDIAQE